jgi:drug/metabolite transporter (DMT)-like permease
MASGSVAKRYFQAYGARRRGRSQTAAALLLAPFAAVAWPEQWPSAATGLPCWRCVLCTGTAYILYFRLIARVGRQPAMTVTFLIPAFAMLWGGLFLGERVTITMLIGCAVILAGTALATGLIKTTRGRVAQPESR